MVAIGITGELSEPTSLVLSTPFGLGPAVAGTTTRLPAEIGRALAPLLRPTGRTVQGLELLDNITTAPVQVIMPLIVEVDADVAIEDGRLQDPARLLRARPDLTVRDLDYP